MKRHQILFVIFNILAVSTVASPQLKERKSEDVAISMFIQRIIEHVDYLTTILQWHWEISQVIRE